MAKTPQNSSFVQAHDPSLDVLLTSLEPPAAGRWDEIRLTLPAAALPTTLDAMALPARVRAAAADEGITTLGELAARSEAALMASPHMTRASVRHLSESVREHFVSIDAARLRASRPPPREDDVRLDSLDLPARLADWAARQGLVTVRQLAEVTPHEMMGSRNLGRKSVADARAVIESTLGARWEHLADRSGAAGARDGVAPDAPAVAPTRWNELRVALSDELRAVSLDEMDLPVRVRSFALTRGYETLGDIAACSEGVLSTAPNLSRHSIERLFEAARDQPRRSEVRRAFASLGMLGAWQSLIMEQEAVPRMVLRRRTALGGSVETLQSIADILGVTRERVRQIETRGLDDLRREVSWLRHVRERADAALVSGAVRLEALAEDEWWREMVELPEALDVFGEHIVGGAFRVIDVDDELFLARCTQERYDAAWRGARTAAMMIRLPYAIDAMRGVVESAMGAYGPALVEATFDRLRESLNIETTTDGTRVIGLGGRGVSPILALLEASPTPLRINELRARTGRKKLPTEVMLLGPALVGLEQHFPDFARWTAAIVPRAIALMEREGPERQWHARALREDLSEELDLPDWLSVTHIGSLLKRSGRVRYLGRLRVALLESGDAQVRVHYHEEVRRILLQGGAPMPREALRRALEAKTSVLEHSFALLLNRPGFLPCDADRVGLAERDLPGGAVAHAEALDHLVDLLERRGRGYGEAQTLAEVQRLSAVHGRWTAPMLWSLVRGDTRFRLSIWGGLGLSCWEGVRVPTRGEIVRQCVEEGGGRASLEVIQEHIVACYGEPSSRSNIAVAAHRIGATLRGSIVEVQGPAQ